MSKKDKKRNKNNTLSFNEWIELQGDNQQIAQILYLQWKITITSILVWKLDGDESLSRHINKYLFEKGRCTIFKDTDGIIKYLPITEQTGLNYLGDIVRWGAVGVNYSKSGLNNDNAVIIRNNVEMLPDDYFVRYIVSKIVNLEGAIDVNVEATKTPIIINTNEDSLLTFKNAWQKVSTNEPVILIDRNLELNKQSQVFNTGVTFLGVELSNMIDLYESRLLKRYGLKYVNGDKKERLVVDEANRGDELVQTNLYSMIKECTIACEQFNKMYPEHKLEVMINHLLMNVSDKEDEDDEGSEGDE